MFGEARGRTWVIAWCVVVAIGTGALAACSPFRSEESACPEADPPSSGRTTPGTAGRPQPVEEALWVADGSGTLRAFDGRSNRISARVDIGRPTRIGEAVLAGAGLVWVYRYETGQITLVDPRRARVVRRVTVP